MKCKNCIKWLYPQEHCIKNKYWCNENYQCITSKKKEGKA